MPEHPTWLAHTCSAVGSGLQSAGVGREKDSKGGTSENVSPVAGCWRSCSQGHWSSLCRQVRAAVLHPRSLPKPLPDVGNSCVLESLVCEGYSSRWMLQEAAGSRLLPWRAEWAGPSVAPVSAYSCGWVLFKLQQEGLMPHSDGGG